jgi:two-component system, chemotaxis family, protein-glutamate methylesterase/glutaminase
MIRVLIADDSDTARALIIGIFAAHPEFAVVGEARDGREALELTRQLRPDVITMDVRMPRMDGLKATRCIMIEVPTPIVIVSSTIDSSDVAASMQAIRAGALMALEKPLGPGSPAFEESARRFVGSVRALAGVKVVSQRLGSRTFVAPRPAKRGADHCEIVGLAASTGGPGALRSVLDALPYDFPVPVVLVQHLANGFLQGFVDWLGTSCRLRVKLAVQGEVLRAGTVYVAPEDRHLDIGPGGIVRTSSEPPFDGFRPSASLLFQSLAVTYGSRVLAAIMTGMGRDGIAGLRRIRAAGGRIIAQDEQTCAVFGMPAAAIEEGLADFVLPISQVAPKLVEVVSQESSG